MAAADYTKPNLPDSTEASFASIEGNNTHHGQRRNAENGCSQERSLHPVFSSAVNKVGASTIIDGAVNVGAPACLHTAEGSNPCGIRLERFVIQRSDHSFLFEYHVDDGSRWTKNLQIAKLIKFRDAAERIADLLHASRVLTVLLNPNNGSVVLCARHAPEQAYAYEPLTDVERSL